MLNFDGNINIIINLNVDHIEFVSEMGDHTKMDKYCNVKFHRSILFQCDIHLTKNKYTQFMTHCIWLSFPELFSRR